ncbi:copper resistance protein [Enterobacter sp. Ap-916]|uniref:copper resistance protein n=1 Tax=unclassified Enterobacter TaxID=2608935 RepID=UPI00141F387B|nr:MULTISPECIES: copper resistance protein [unclassified Enterobacter]NIF57344.1 copper resistance protein [Enterobacter sp. Ap-867]NIG28714.1 copper resistance protein [Enterobacter sp. Ap-916]
MVKQRRIGIWFLCLACVVVLVCTAQRMAGLHALQMETAASAVAAQADNPQADADSPVTPCELSTKSLLSVPPVLFDGALFALCLLLSLLAPVRSTRMPFSAPRATSPPTLRVHLRFCVFRE